MTLALLTCVGCAGVQSPTLRWDRDAEVLPLYQPPAAEQPRLRSVVILLPEADGTVGVIDVASADGTATLDQARQGVAFDDLDSTFITDEAEIRQVDGLTLNAEPEPPRGFTVYFPSGSTSPVADSEAAWSAILEAIVARRVPEVTIAAHADRMGSERSNMDLSRRRAVAVRDALVVAGVDPELIELAWFGETRPAVPTTDGVAERRNRRAEIRLR